MKAVVTDFEGPEHVKLDDVDAPSPGPDEILVRVAATALNRADLMQTQGFYPAPPGVVPNIPGLEYAGEVVELGARVTRWKIGDRVMGLVAGGAWADLLVTHEREALPVPESLTLTQAAALPEAYCTAFDALVTQAGMTHGTRVLIHAVASGVGTAALQLANLYGALVIGTGRNDAKLTRAKALGLRHAVLVQDGQFADAVQQLGGADLALDLVGGAYVGETINAMNHRGTIMLVGLSAGASSKIPLAPMLNKRLRVMGTVLRARPLEEKIAVARAAQAHLVPHFASGALKPVIDATLPMTDIVDALKRLAANDSFGKLVLTW